MEKEFIVYQSKLKQIGLSFLGMLMVLASLLIIIAGIGESNYLMLVIGLIGFVFFGASELFLIKKVFKGKKIVVLKEEGFYDYSTLMATKDRLIPWKEVQKIENQRILNQEFVSVYLKNPEPFLAKLSAPQRKSIKANVKMGFGEINITLQSAKKCSNEQLTTKMHEYCHLFETV